MTSYNLIINGVHTSESVTAPRSSCITRGGASTTSHDKLDSSVALDPRRHETPRATAAATVKAGNELFMPGGEPDRDDLWPRSNGERRSAIGRADQDDGGGPDARRARETGRPRHPHGSERLATTLETGYVKVEAGRLLNPR